MEHASSSTPECHACVWRGNEFLPTTAGHSGLSIAFGLGGITKTLGPLRTRYLSSYVATGGIPNAQTSHRLARKWMLQLRRMGRDGTPAVVMIPSFGIAGRFIAHSDIGSQVCSKDAELGDRIYLCARHLAGSRSGMIEDVNLNYRDRVDNASSVGVEHSTDVGYNLAGHDAKVDRPEDPCDQTRLLYCLAESPSSLVTSGIGCRSSVMDVTHYYAIGGG